jgi:hypothetical protein
MRKIHVPDSPTTGRQLHNNQIAHHFCARHSAGQSVEPGTRFRIENHELLLTHLEFQEMVHVGPNWVYYTQTPCDGFFIFHFMLPKCNI